MFTHRASTEHVDEGLGFRVHPGMPPFPIRFLSLGFFLGSLRLVAWIFVRKGRETPGTPKPSERALNSVLLCPESRERLRVCSQSGLSGLGFGPTLSQK